MGKGDSEEGKGLGSVADALLDVLAESGQGLGVTLGDKDRIVAKPVVSRQLPGDAALEGAKEAVDGFSGNPQSQDASKTGGSLFVRYRG
jgi:hypothetical protein